MAHDVEKIISLAYVLPIVFRRRGQLLTQADYLRLVSSKNLSDLNLLLTEKSYGNIFVGKSDSAIDLEKRIGEALVKTSFRLADSAPLPMRTFLRLYLSKPVYLYFAAILKKIIDPSTRRSPPKEIDAYIWNRIGIGELMKKALKAESVQELEEITKNSDYSKAIKEAMSLYWKHGFLYVVELAFAKSYFEQVYGALVDIPSPDRDDIRHILSIETDAYNALTILRSKKWDMPKPMLEEIIVRCPSIINDKMVSRLIASDIPNTLRIVSNSKYGHQFLKREDLSSADVAIEFRIIEAHDCWKILLGDPFNYAQIFAVLRLMDVEKRNLLAVIHGKDAKLANERILQYVTTERS